MKAAFFDRDGTINVNYGHVYRCEDLKFVHGIPEIIREYNDEGIPVIVVTNQAGIAKGIYTEADMQRFHAYMNEQLKQQYGAHIDYFYFCPHHPEYTGFCACRKPNAGLFFRAAEELSISLSESIMYGDTDSDREAAKAAGLHRFVLVKDENNIK